MLSVPAEGEEADGAPGVCGTVVRVTPLDKSEYEEVPFAFVALILKE